MKKTEDGRTRTAPSQERRPGSSERPRVAGKRTTPRAQAIQTPAGPYWDRDEAPRLCGTIGPGRAAPGRRKPGTRPGDPSPRTWRQKVALVALWKPGGRVLASGPRSQPGSVEADRGPPTDRPIVGASAECPGISDGADGRCPAWPHRVASLVRASRSGHRVPRTSDLEKFHQAFLKSLRFQENFEINFISSVRY